MIIDVHHLDDGNVHVVFDNCYGFEIEEWMAARLEEELDCTLRGEVAPQEGWELMPLVIPGRSETDLAIHIGEAWFEIEEDDAQKLLARL